MIFALCLFAQYDKIVITEIRAVCSEGRTLHTTLGKTQYV